MKSYRITIPRKGIQHTDADGFAQEIHSFLSDHGLTIGGVTIERHADYDSGPEAFRMVGPFVRIESESDPYEVLSAFDWKPPVDPDVETLTAFLDTISKGNELSEGAIIDVLAALVRRTLGQSNPQP